MILIWSIVGFLTLMALAGFFDVELAKEWLKKHEEA